MSKISKNTKIIIAAIAVLLPVVIILAILHFRNMQERLEYHEEGSFMVILGDDRVHVSIEDLMILNPQELSASPRGNTRNFTGVPIVDILRHTGLDYTQGASLTFSSIDGFMSGISMEEALNPSHAFVVFLEDGEPLESEGGSFARAPFMVVLVDDPFPNRWARYLFEVVIQP